ncbi:unnamed protein product [Cuscuta europaea]|uniref:Uncharacterized protein n=1 Tax=Cuscuta europaea TaxID=41803 RepID=A0A9P0ZLJ8_CUSEU|nr:unnamed protein product [Cuscuta europaea]
MVCTSSSFAIYIPSP